MDWLQKVSRLHDKWIHIALVYGAGEYAEDCVQNAYIKLYKYADAEKVICKDGHVKDGYVFFVVKTCVMEYHKQKQFHEELEKCRIADTPTTNEDEIQRLWLEIDAYTAAHYPLYRRMLYKMWRKNYTIREMCEMTEVSPPTIVKELKYIKKDIKKKFTNEYNDTQKETRL